MTLTHLQRRLAGLLVLAAAFLYTNDLSAQGADEVTLKDGSRIVGTIKSMENGTLLIDTLFSADPKNPMKIKWEEVATIKTGKDYPFVLEDGSSVNGAAQAGGEGRLQITNRSSAQPNSVAMASITAINPAPKPFANYKINLSVGASVSDGNTNNRTANALGEFEMRTEHNRLTLNAYYNYQDSDQEGVTAQNGRGFIKYDYFITKRLYWFVSALFEHDGFQDLNLRTALSTGPGYQFIDKGDFQSDWVKDMQLYGEAGIAYFDEDHRSAPDDQFVSARWAIKFDWPIMNRVTLFHFDEGYPSLERGEDLYINTQQGVRFTIIDHFIATFQVNWRWDNTPTPGFERSDTLYIFTLGYALDFAH